MGQMGSCVHCRMEWDTIRDNKKVRPKWIPTCPEGEIGVICEDCFDELPSREIISLVQEKEKSGRTVHSHLAWNPDARVISMTPTEYLLVDSSIRDWVLYMKGEQGEPPFEQVPLAL